MSHTCSKCGKAFTLLESNSYNEKSTYRIHDRLGTHITNNGPYSQVRHNNLLVEYFNCPDNSCENVDVKVSGTENFFTGRELWFNPLSNAKVYPDIDEDINKYYQEAHVVLQFSPRASAALSRACLESILLTHYKISSRTLFDKINDFKKQVNDMTIRITYDFVEALDGIRIAGNAGVHEELKTEISNDEALKVITVLEMFLDEIYIHEKSRKESLKQVTDIGNRISANKKGVK